MSTTEERLAELERRLLGRVVVAPEDQAHPTGGCWFCGLAVAALADEDGRCWFPTEPDGPNAVCFECFADAHEFGAFDGVWRPGYEHRDVVVCRLLGQAGWEPGIHERVGWRWFHELDLPVETDRYANLYGDGVGFDLDEQRQHHRFAWVHYGELRRLADPEPGALRDPEQLGRLWGLMEPKPRMTVAYNAFVDPNDRAAGAARFVDGPHKGQPAVFNHKTGSWLPA